MSIKSFVNTFTESEWIIGFIDTPLNDIIANKPLKVWWVKSNYKQGWFADPFILDVTDSEIILLCEEFYYRINRGRISKIVVDLKTHEIKTVIPILTLDTHLSFPAILRKNNEVYIYPENYKGGGLNIYRYDKNNDYCEFVIHISDILLTDAVITELFGDTLCFSTNEPYPNGESHSVYLFDNNQMSKITDNHFTSKIARNAGDFFKVENSIYRPAQDCNISYGAGVIIQKVEKLSDQSFVFTNIRRLFLTKGKFTHGCHTFNHYRGVTVVDAHGYRYPYRALIRIGLSKIKSLFR